MCKNLQFFVFVKQKKKERTESAIAKISNLYANYIFVATDKSKTLLSQTIFKVTFQFAQTKRKRKVYAVRRHNGSFYQMFCKLKFCELNCPFFEFGLGVCMLAKEHLQVAQSRS